MYSARVKPADPRGKCSSYSAARAARIVVSSRRSCWFMGRVLHVGGTVRTVRRATERRKDGPNGSLRQLAATAARGAARGLQPRTPRGSVCELAASANWFRTSLVSAHVPAKARERVLNWGE